MSHDHAGDWRGSKCCVFLLLVSGDPHKENFSYWIQTRSRITENNRDRPMRHRDVVTKNKTDSATFSSTKTTEKWLSCKRRHIIIQPLCLVGREVSSVRPPQTSCCESSTSERSITLRYLSSFSSSGLFKGRIKDEILHFPKCSSHPSLRARQDLRQETNWVQIPRKSTTDLQNMQVEKEVWFLYFISTMEAAHWFESQFNETTWVSSGPDEAS